jgi:hypothetical protein
LTSDQVTNAATAALANTLTVNAEDVKVTVSESRRLSLRRLAGSWAVEYEVKVTEDTQATVSDAITLAASNSTTLTSNLKSAFVDEGVSAETIKDMQVTVSAPTTITKEAPTPAPTPSTPPSEDSAFPCALLALVLLAQ